MKLSAFGIEAIQAQHPTTTGTGDYQPIPAGWYAARIVEADVRTAKSNASSMYLLLRFEIIGPSYVGRHVFGRITLRNASAQAESIGRAQLAELAYACGLNVLTDTDELIGRELSVRVTVRPAAAGYPASNDVRGFKPLHQAPQAQAQPHPQAPPAAVPSASANFAPWAKPAAPMQASQAQPAAVPSANASLAPWAKQPTQG